METKKRGCSLFSHELANPGNVSTSLHAFPFSSTQEGFNHTIRTRDCVQYVLEELQTTPTELTVSLIFPCEFDHSRFRVSRLIVCIEYDGLAFVR